MLSFDFSYQEHQIRYTVDFMGREKVYLNETLIAKPTNWFKSVTSITINIGNETLTLHRMIASWSNAEYQLTLTNDKKIIDKQSQLYFAKSMGDNNEALMFKGNESQWVQEIKPPQRTLHLALWFYMVSVFYSIAEGVFEQDWLLPMALAVGGIILSYSIFDFIHSAVQALFTKEQKDHKIESAKA